jgi:hypothetical protein
MNPDWQVNDDTAPAFARALAAGVFSRPEFLTTGGVEPSLLVTVASNMAVNDTIEINDIVFTFVTASANAHQVTIGVSAAASITALATAVGSAGDGALANLSVAASAGNILITYGKYGTLGNGIAVAVTGAHLAIGAGLAGALAGGVDVEVSTNVAASVFNIGASAQHFNLRHGIEGQEHTFFAEAVGGGGSAVVSMNDGANSLTFSAAAQYAKVAYLGGKWVHFAETATFA